MVFSLFLHNSSNITIAHVAKESSFQCESTFTTLYIKVVTHKYLYTSMIFVVQGRVQYLDIVLSSYRLWNEASILSHRFSRYSFITYHRVILY